MSVRALTWSFNLRLDDMAAKAALHALADHADEDGVSWPSVERIARYAGCSEKTARRALARLAELGLVQRDARSGKSDLFTLIYTWHPSHKGSGQTVHPQIDHSQPDHAPLPPCPDTPPKLTTDPSHGGSRTTKNRHLNRQGTVNDQRAKLPADWRPTTDDRDHAIDKGLDSETTAAAFTDYFGEGRGRGEKRTIDGWSKRFRIWCNTDSERKGSGVSRVRPAVAGGDASAFARAAHRLGGDEPVR